MSRGVPETSALAACYGTVMMAAVFQHMEMIEVVLKTILHS